MCDALFGGCSHKRILGLCDLKRIVRYISFRNPVKNDVKPLKMVNSDDESQPNFDVTRDTFQKSVNKSLQSGRFKNLIFLRITKVLLHSSDYTFNPGYIVMLATDEKFGRKHKSTVTIASQLQLLEWKPEAYSCGALKHKRCRYSWKSHQYL